MEMLMDDTERLAMATAYGYTEPRIMPDGTLAALGKQLYTTGIVVGIDDTGYSGRYCYGSHAVAAAALRGWDGVGDPPGPWLKYKGTGGERLRCFLMDQWDAPSQVPDTERRK